MAEETDFRRNLEVFAGRCPPSTLIMDETEDDFVFSVDETAAQIS